ncbi:phospholipase [Spirosoma sp. KCTC 42546]|uniref:phospholipase D-like domain-containing protein n=1 Tax=Spirosoma sp. KCTC 42546 TaxID=2520506 RepID=UPI001157F607|nr:phospholipase D-like domain-containing protein [Spirosoma sp. KCTC 42546]QDK78544.1 phospholipase [Spirosoma sp. KCTC 42546]
MKTYRGIVRVRKSDILLDAGGVEVKLDGNYEELAPLDGLQTTIAGEQEGAVIRNATPASEAESVAIQDPFEPIIAAIASQQDRLRTIEGVFGVRPGISTTSSDDVVKPVIVVVTNPAETFNADAVPSTISGIPVEIRPATPLELTAGLLPLAAWADTAAGDVAEAVPPIGYVPPKTTEVALVEMDVHNITCHVGPDAGWITLKPFLEGTTRSLTVAMYEFYATHIIDTVTRLGKETTDKLNMILQVSANDKQIQQTLKDSWGTRLDFAKASVSGPNRIFNNSYHTKVAVRDSKSFWLSSGNWSPNSQPAIQPGNEQSLFRLGNREWHVIIDNEPMAQMYEKFIKYDMRMARKAGESEVAAVMPDLLIPQSLDEAEAVFLQPKPFLPKTFATTGEPVRVKPLMSPDNYAPEILNLIQRAQLSIYLQFSYIRQPSTGDFDAIISAIAEKMAAGLDVRILVGSSQQADHSELLIGKRGWKREQFRMQSSKLHNKGVLVDGNIAVVGSNNWSSDGTQFNRDTSLVFFSRPIAQYYTEVFLFDWTNLSRPINKGTGITPVIAPESGPTPLGMVRIPWQAWFDE